MQKKSNQSFRYLSKRPEYSVQHNGFCHNTKKASNLAQEPTEKCKPSSTDLIDESERVQTSQPVRQVPSMRGLNNGLLQSWNRNSIPFFVGPNKSSSLFDEVNTLRKELKQERKTSVKFQSTRSCGARSERDWNANLKLQKSAPKRFYCLLMKHLQVRYLTTRWSHLELLQKPKIMSEGRLDPK